MTGRSIKEAKHWIWVGRVLTEALPYMRHYEGSSFVIKYGGHAMGDAKLAENFANDIGLVKHAGIDPIVVHGGGPQIGEMLERLKIKSEFRFIPFQPQSVVGINVNITLLSIAGCWSPKADNTAAVHICAARQEQAAVVIVLDNFIAVIGKNKLVEFVNPPNFIAANCRRQIRMSRPVHAEEANAVGGHKDVLAIKPHSWR